jgi:translation initiation factor IF-1
LLFEMVEARRIAVAYENGHIVMASVA